MWCRAGRSLRQSRRAGLLTYQLRLYTSSSRQAWLVTGSSTVVPLTAPGISVLRSVPFSSVSSPEIGEFGSDEASLQPSSVPSQVANDDAESQEDEIQSTRMKSTLQSSTRKEILARISDGDLDDAISQMDSKTNGMGPLPMFARQCLRSCQTVEQVEKMVSALEGWGMEKDSLHLAPTLMVCYFSLGEDAKAQEIFDNRSKEDENENGRVGVFIRARVAQYAKRDQVAEFEEFLAALFPSEGDFDELKRNVLMRFFFEFLLEFGQIDSAVELFNKSTETESDNVRARLNPMNAMKKYITQGKPEAVKNCETVCKKIGWSGQLQAKACTEIVDRMLTDTRFNISKVADVVEAAHAVDQHVALRPFADFSVTCLRDDKIPAFHYLLHRIEELGCSPAAWRYLFNAIFKSIDHGTIQHIGMLWKQLETRAAPNHMTKVILTSKESRLRFLHHPDIPYNLLSFVGAGVSDDWSQQQQNYNQNPAGGGYAPHQQNFDDFGAQPNYQQYDNQQYAPPQQQQQYAPQQQQQYAPQQQQQYAPPQNQQYPPPQNQQYQQPPSQYGSYDQAPPANHPPQQGGGNNNNNYEPW